jgi:ABC-type phosphate transport system substrate-binding protein
MESPITARFWLVAVALSGLFALAGARPVEAQISVIVGPGSSYSPSQAEVVEMFVGAKTTWNDGTRVQVVDQPETATGATFYEQVLGRSPAEVRRAFIELVLSGQASKPERAGSDAEVKAAVARLPGAIGFIQSSALDSSVKEVLRIN